METLRKLNLKYLDCHAGRAFLLTEFEKNVIFLLENEFIGTNVSVAVVGGSNQEPELKLLKEKFSISLKVFGIETEFSDVYLDLNEEIRTNELRQKFDLVLCNQVLEHIWNLKSAFKVLNYLTKTSGLIWVSCPASNRVHGSPEYFSAGYMRSFLQKNLNNYGFEMISSNSIGTERLYKMTHAQQNFSWPSLRELNSPIGRTIKCLLNKNLKAQIRNVLNIPSVFQSYFWTNKKEYNSKFATETFYLGRKVNDRV